MRKLKIKIPPLKEFFKKETLVKYFKKFIGMKATPHKLAWSVAIGVFIGFIIPIGFQTFFIIPLAVAFEVNIVVAYLSTLVSNPVTAIPMYYVAVNVGEYITGIRVSWESIAMIIRQPSIDAILNLGTDSLIVFFAGSFLLGIFASVLLYFLTLKIVVYYRKLHKISID